MDNKGLTLVELLISIVLVGIVVVFLFQLLMDLKDEADNRDFAFDNQINRIEAVYAVQKDLIDYVLVGIEDNSSNNDILINFYFRRDGEDKIAILNVKNSQKDISLSNNESYGIKSSVLKYKSVDGTNYKWTMKDAYIDSCGVFDFYKDSTANSYYLKLNLYVYNSILNEKNKPNNNNIIDDIEITSVGSLLDLNSNDNYLTNYSGNKHIGNC